MKIEKVIIAAAVALIAMGASAQTAKPKFSAELGYTAIDYSESGYSARPSLVRAVLGYEVHENLAIEGMAASGVSNGNVTILNVPAEVKVESSFGIYLKPKVLVTPSLELFLRLGYATTKVSASIPGFSASNTVSEASYGAGLSYSLSPVVSLNADYLYYYSKDGAVAKGPTIGIGFKF